ncbi:MAG: hypothetical protein KGM24_13390 [Elusimicrobia bacterium]|nr:hypothetical protein [Elusimicrobiota bacterium]
MKKNLVLTLTLALAAAAALPAAAAPSELGVGVALGEPIGVTAKVPLNGPWAADAGAGLSDGNFGLWGDALWNDPTLLPQPRKGKLTAYAGAGPQLRTGGDMRFGLRTIVGASYRFDGHPIELYAEVGPMFRFTQGGHVDPVGAVGLRLYFQVRKGAL